MFRNAGSDEFDANGSTRPSNTELLLRALLSLVQEKRYDGIDQIRSYHRNDRSDRTRNLQQAPNPKINGGWAGGSTRRGAAELALVIPRALSELAVNT
jgi:hypothetical protein